MKAPKHAKTNFRSLQPFLEALEASNGYLRLEVPGYEPLTMENLQYSDYRSRPVYNMAHWYEQNGDLCCDPDMTFSVDTVTGEIWPQTYQLDAFGLFHEAFVRQRDGKMTYSPRLLLDLDQFLWQWLKNLNEQGFVEALSANVNGAC